MQTVQILSPPSINYSAYCCRSDILISTPKRQLSISINFDRAGLCLLTGEDTHLIQSKCRPCATPSIDGSTENEANSPAAKNGVFSRNTKYDLPEKINKKQRSLRENQVINDIIDRITPFVPATITSKKPNSSACGKRRATATPMSSPLACSPSPRAGKVSMESASIHI